MISIIIEYVNENVLQGLVSEELWLNVLQRELDTDDTVSHYVAEII